ncbi:MAG: AarF/ABC1/UbiB kinase family protein [archaeon]|jgi:ubiquinone biosynthesis protein
MGIFREEKISAYRVARIAKILSKYGFNTVAEKIGIRGKIPFLSDKKSDSKCNESRIICDYDSHERTKMVLEDLGPTFVKLGQILSTRPDLVGVDLSVELAKLQDSVKPVSYEEVKYQIEFEFGKPIHSVFKSFEKIPFASASLAQVHKAVTKEGKTVVVKVQRPGIEEIIHQDIQIMHYLAKFAEKHNPVLRQLRSPEIIEEFERSLQKELNFLFEGKNILRFREIFKGDPQIVIPEYFEELSTSKILTMGFISGVPLSEIIAGKEIKGINKPLVAKICVNAYFKQLLEHGFFHADLHPGNMIRIEKNKIGFVDFGMIGWLEQSKIEDLSRLFMNLVDCDVTNMMIQLDAMELINEDTDKASLREDISDLIETYYGLDMKDVNLGKSATELMVLLTKHNIRIPKEYTMLSRSLLLVESSAKSLDPEFSAVELFKPYLIKLITKKLSPEGIVARIKSQLFDLDSLARTLPKSVRNIIKVIEGGKIKLEFEHKNLDVFANQLENIVNKLSIAIILAAIIIGSAMAMLSAAYIHVYGLQTLSFVGFAISIVIGFIFVFVSLRRVKLF